MLEVGALFAACVSLSLMSDTLTKRVLQQDRSLTVTVTFFHFAMSALAGTVVVPALAPRFRPFLAFSSFLLCLCSLVSVLLPRLALFKRMRAGQV